jgi:hypothetical protein
MVMVYTVDCGVVALYSAIVLSIVFCYTNFQEYWELFVIYECTFLSIIVFRITILVFIFVEYIQSLYLHSIR